MFLDFQDYRPDTPRIPTAISVREAVLISLVVHLLVVIAYLLMPERFFEEAVPVEVVQQQPESPPLRFVEVLPQNDMIAPPIRPADQSDQDRRSATRERPPDAIDPSPAMRGNTPEMVQGGPPAAPPPSPPPAPQPTEQMADASRLPPSDMGFAEAPPAPADPVAARPSSRPLSESLRDLQQYFRQENFDNPRGGNTEQSADIQFDSMGIDFGPWLRRFKNQVERNWLVPAAAMTTRTRVVIRFNVLRNGVITDLEVLQPASIPALTNAALNSLRLSNPTAALPPEYPADKVLFTVTFYYNLDPRSQP
jgi:TonB family protein